MDSQSNAQHPTWRPRVPLLVLVWPLPFDLSATGGIALRVIGVIKLPYHDKVEAPAVQPPYDLGL
jgi:hypothetical protein